jgi:acetyltransferase-like isoleucine patch superfamily enzyme
VAVGQGVILMEHVEILAEPAIGTEPTGPLVTFGDGTRLARFATIWATLGIHLGKGVLSSDYVSLMDCWGSIEGMHNGIPAPQGAPIVIEDGAYLGCRCVIGPGVTVGEGAFVGEGSVVRDDVPPRSVVYGNPARVTSQWDEGHGWQGAMFGNAAS